MSIKYDGKIDLAIGKSRIQKAWTNKKFTWTDLLKKISKTQRTYETYAEYCGMKRDKQDEIKDVGGFIGGYLAQGKRKISNVLYRQLITLDIDLGTPEFWDSFQLTYACAAALYTTHKHCSDAPRYRLIIPLHRQAKVDEYAAISRRIAGDLNIELFDSTTFQPSRLMYWPSTAKDGEYVFQSQDGPWLNVDKVLKRYVDWRDSSAWPVSERSEHAFEREMKKQGDPLEKHGIIGAFCRSYSIESVIDEYLSDIYEPAAIEGRYTYTEGSTAAGLVVYDEKFAFSHHGTDPASGKLCNAFDLVRLHKFHLLDAEATEETKGNQMPSYKAMVELAVKDKTVRKLLGRERLESAKNDFAGLIVETSEMTVDEEGDLLEEVTDPQWDKLMGIAAKVGVHKVNPEEIDFEVDDKWLEKLKVDQNGKNLSTINNIVLVLDNDPELRGRLAYDEFSETAIARVGLPWRSVSKANADWTDSDDAGLRHYLEHNYQLTGMNKVKDAIDIMFYRNRFHPVREYLDSLQWDQTPRVETVFINYMGAEDNPYTRAVARKFLCAAVARVYKPGCKFDYATILVGDEGIKKSMLVDKLGRHWYSDSFMGVEGAKAFEQLHGVWIMEIPELNGLRKAENDAVKHFISKREDAFRPAYGKRKVNRPRQTVFAGTTNRTKFLHDTTGNRKYWPVLTQVQPIKADVAKIKPNTIDQIWAEAVELYNAGELLYLSKELEDFARDVQEAHRETDARESVIAEYLEKLLPANWESMNTYQRRAYIKGDDEMGEGTKIRTKVSIHELWTECLDGQLKDMNQHNTKPIHNIMRKMKGWSEPKSRMKVGNSRPRGYVRAE